MVGKCLGNKIINADGFDKMCNNMLQYGMSCKNIAVKINEYIWRKFMSNKKINKKEKKEKEQKVNPIIQAGLERFSKEVSKDFRKRGLL